MQLFTIGLLHGKKERQSVGSVLVCRQNDCLLQQPFAQILADDLPCRFAVAPNQRDGIECVAHRLRHGNRWHSILGADVLTALTAKQTLEIGQLFAWNGRAL